MARTRTFRNVGYPVAMGWLAETNMHKYAGGPRACASLGILGYFRF